MSWFERKLYMNITKSASFTPVWSNAAGGSFTTDPTVGYAKSWQILDRIYFSLYAHSGNIGGSSAYIRFTVPAGITGSTGYGACWLRDGDGTPTAGMWRSDTGSTIRVYKEDVTSFVTGANLQIFIDGSAEKS